MKYGIVQGRLLPQVGDFIQNFPIENWRDEFGVAKNIGASHIEFIDGAPNEECSTQSRLDKDLISSLEVPISAVCFDWFVKTDHMTSWDRTLDGLELIFTIEEYARLGIKKIVLPLLEKASLSTLAQLDEFLFATVLCELRDVIAECPDVMFSVETDLDADEIQLLLKALPKNTSVTFDLGNLTKLGYNLGEHVLAYGDRIDNVHVKDFKTGVGSVQLGTGDTDLTVLKKLLKLPNVEYVTFQTARSPGSEIDTFRHNVSTIEKVLCS